LNKGTLVRDFISNKNVSGSSELLLRSGKNDNRCTLYNQIIEVNCRGSYTCHEDRKCGMSGRLAVLFIHSAAQVFFIGANGTKPTTEFT
jgi:hypothetical protein